MNGNQINSQQKSVLLGANVLINAVGFELDKRGQMAEESYHNLEQNR